MRRLFSYLLLLPTLSFAQVPHTFNNGEVADANKINENFSQLSALVLGTGDSSRFLEQRTLPDGNVFTKLYFYESGHYSGVTINRRPDGAYESWGDESLTNALGTFVGKYTYVYPPAEEIPPPTNTDLPATCPGGEAPEFDFQASYAASYRNQTGAIHFDTTIGDMSGIYLCPSYDCGSDCPTGDGPRPYYIWEGEGLGGYECIESVVLHGLLGGGNARGFKKIRGPYAETGYFNPESNGLFGTYYLEIVAPAGCIPTM